MPGPTSPMAKWTARENKQDGPVLLLVGGNVKVANANQDAHLTELPAGDPPKMLKLNVSVTTGKDAGKPMEVWKRAAFSKNVTPGQYSEVGINQNGALITRVKVMNDKQYAQYLAGLTRLANAEHPPTRKPPPGKKRASGSTVKSAAAKKKRAPAPKKKRAKAAAKKKRPAARRR